MLGCDTCRLIRNKLSRGSQLPGNEDRDDLETSVYSPFNHMTRLLARENVIEFSRRENVKLYIRNVFTNLQDITPHTSIILVLTSV